MENHSQLILDKFKDTDRVMMVNFVIINSFIFAKGLFIHFSSEMHQIDAVLKYNESFIFLCTKYSTVKFYKFGNCFEIEKMKKFSLIKINDLVYKKT